MRKPDSAAEFTLEENLKKWASNVCRSFLNCSRTTPTPRAARSSRPVPGLARVYQ
jgi:hypothetical protein